MTFSEIALPSNRKFGFFFTFVFAVAAAYFYNATTVSWAYTFGAASLIFLVVTSYYQGVEWGGHNDHRLEPNKRSYKVVTML